ncbi:hypothetical protein M1329_00630 [Candidatus Marsarchaeota archaeon]|jgi:hypothetical protein|nr:hypothetical protein [Candidatus Marsarchaeota archaeon]MCL5099738.1 hypothetical protein [Candidatus Marsarchaeota archaeon]
MSESKDKQQPGLAGLLRERIPGEEGVSCKIDKWDLGRLEQYFPKDLK